MNGKIAYFIISLKHSYIHRQNFKESTCTGFSDFKVVDKNSCYITIVTFHDSKVSKIKL